MVSGGLTRRLTKVGIGRRSSDGPCDGEPINESTKLSTYPSFFTTTITVISTGNTFDQLVTLKLEILTTKHHYNLIFFTSKFTTPSTTRTE